MASDIRKGKRESRENICMCLYLGKKDPCMQLGKIKTQERLGATMMEGMEPWVAWQIGVICNFVCLRITDASSISETHIWSMLLIKSDLKWRIDLRGSFLFIYQILQMIII